MIWYPYEQMKTMAPPISITRSQRSLFVYRKGEND